MLDPGFVVQTMKRAVDGLVAHDNGIQAFLTLCDEEAERQRGTYKIGALRAFFFKRVVSTSFDADKDLDLIRGLDPAFSTDLSRVLRDRKHLFGRSISLVRSLDLTKKLDLNGELAMARELIATDQQDRMLMDALGRLETLSITTNQAANYAPLVEGLDHALELASVVAPVLVRQIDILRTELPKRPDQWWRRRHWSSWREKLGDLVKRYQYLSYEWTFTDEQMELLRRYERTNRLLVDCLTSSRILRNDTRMAVEESILLPVARGEEQRSGSR